MRGGGTVWSRKRKITEGKKFHYPLSWQKITSHHFCRERRSSCQCCGVHQHFLTTGNKHQNGPVNHNMRLPARHTVKRRQRGWTLLRETEKCISKHIIKIVMKQSILLITNSCYSFGIFCHYNFCHNTLHVQFLNILKRRNYFYLRCERELTVLVSQWKSKLPMIV